MPPLLLADDELLDATLDELDVDEGIEDAIEELLDELWLPPKCVASLEVALIPLVLLIR